MNASVISVNLMIPDNLAYAMLILKNNIFYNCKNTRPLQNESLGKCPKHTFKPIRHIVGIYLLHPIKPIEEN